ncbi:lipocalin family protein [Aeromonas cavernicola]|uniref:Outer membrane lipoprotein Blc n=1 Tax=Aeromonas cavernicola TaxID=1006623 RepID=A0A2H9U8V0_9GAMM|nr:lipocalin family protein [Aeromonas cavernicola]PJG60432.1 lipocalin [Aeromonas cavernicola]
MRLLLGLLTGLLLTACTGLADGVRPITGFQLERYLGTWYEIARLDHSFERGLEQVSATYSLRDDGGVKVVNRGREANGSWREAEGKAYFVDKPDEARLKVSFFGPFYGGYNVIDLDPDYQLSLVTSYNHDYLWILSRQPNPPQKQLDAVVAKAKKLGFATDKLIWVKQP